VSKTYDEIAKTPIEYLKGVGPDKGRLLREEISVANFGDLLHYFPFRYVDRTRFYSISEVPNAPGEIQIIGKLIALQAVAGKNRRRRLIGRFSDGKQSIELVWFSSVAALEKLLQLNTPYLLFGKPQQYQGTWSFVHPELETYSPERHAEFGSFYPVYSTTEKLSAKGLNGRAIGKLVKALLPQFNGKISENLPPSITEKYRLIPRQDALFSLHFPAGKEEMSRAKLRLVYEELFFVQLGLVRQKLVNRTKIKGNIIEEVGPIFNRFFNEVLPFDLTNAQKRVVREIRRDMGSGAQMNRLLQGDVGSGKTIVALLSMLLVYDNGFQACLMAPTEILAKQHFAGLSELLAPLNLEIALLTGSTPAAERRKMLAKLSEGSLPFIVGTHALLEDRVQFKALGLAVIDEQHRFGVAQRSRLWTKNPIPPHILVMTATPIPRTLAMTLYGDLDLSVIDELPPGRKPITTKHYTESKRLAVYGFMKDQIALGRQVYVVFPLIKESEKQDYQDLMSGFESICRSFPEPNYSVSVVHGQLPNDEKDREMQAFVEGKTHIMVATTVIEVGVNVPNASVMVIESAERFGLSQLHQLRGRVGRGADQSYCLLMTGFKLSKEAKLRLKTMEETNDGFRISEVDLSLRGPGDMAGTRQSGEDQLKVASLARDGKILEAARTDVIQLLEKDPQLESAENTPTRQHYVANYAKSQSWSRIS
jgi:ATP-dependent DNA helicase RecG